MLWTPTFASPDLEREYQGQLVAEKIRLTRMLALLGMVLNLCFVVLDFWAIPSALGPVWLLRAAIVAMLLVTLASTWHGKFDQFYTALIVATFLVMAAGINGMILLARPDEAAIDQYYGGLLLIIIGLHTLTYLNLWLALGLSLLMIGAYAVIVVTVHGYVSGAPQVIMVANLFVGLSATVIGMVAQALRDRYARENYLLRHSLQRDVELKEEENRRASYLAEHDPLTGLANRLCFERQAEELMRGVAATGASVAVMFIDLDDFKPVNDRHGHAVGDRVLRLIAERLSSRLRGNDVCARFGGDEFVVAMTVPVGETAAVAATAARLTSAIGQEIEMRGTAIYMTASIGIAAYPQDGRDLASLLQRADERMYAVKRDGRNGIGMPPIWDGAAAPARSAS